MDKDFKNIEENNPNKKRKILIEYYVIAEMLIDKKNLISQQPNCL